MRHGETVDNARQVMQGQTPGQLNANGIRQAELVRDRLQTEHIDAFVSSDLKRSLDTCRIIALPHGKSITTTPLLRERDWGSFTGRYIPDLKDAPWTDDIETLEAMKQRARKFLEMVKENYPGQTVLAVGHGIINKAVQSVYYGRPMNEIEKMQNAEVRTLLL